MTPINSNNVSETLLLLQMEQGCEESFNALFEKYWDKAYSAAYARLGDSDQCKDIVQEIFTHIWLKRETLHIDNLPAYLNVAVRNRVLKFVEKQKNTSPFFDILENMQVSSSRTDGNLLWKEFLAAYEALLNTLPAKRQTIFRLHFQDDIPTKDIAKELGISRKTVQNQLGKAVEKLKVSLSPLLPVLLLIIIY